MDVGQTEQPSAATRVLWSVVARTSSSHPSVDPTRSRTILRVKQDADRLTSIRRGTTTVLVFQKEVIRISMGHLKDSRKMVLVN